MPGVTRPVETEVAGVRRLLLEMADAAEEMLREALRALATHDLGLAADVMAREEVVDALQARVEQACIALLGRRQPVARDLRLIVAALRISGDLERVGGQAVGIARAAADLAGRRPAGTLELGEMARVATAMLTDALDQFIRSDAGRARLLLERDHGMDALRAGFLAALLQAMREDARTIGPCLTLLGAGRGVERVAELAEDIAAAAVYAACGERVAARPRVEERRAS